MSVPSALEPELAHYQRQFEEATAAATRLSEGLDPDHIAWRPAPDRWSIGECLEHLNVTVELVGYYQGEEVARVGSYPWVDTSDPHCLPSSSSGCQQVLTLPPVPEGVPYYDSFAFLTTGQFWLYYWDLLIVDP